MTLPHKTAVIRPSVKQQIAAAMQQPTPWEKRQQQLALSATPTKAPQQAPVATKRRFQGRRDNTKYGKRHKPGVMNQTEEAYAARLDARVKTGEVVGWAFESVTFKLADDCRYTPDFAVLLADGSFELVDAKGGGPIDPKSLVKIRCAAEKFFAFRFVIEQKRSKKNGGGWKRIEF